VLGVALAGGLAIGAAALGLGFVQFAQSLATAELPARAIPKADGIVVLTGGAQRVPDAIDLLQGGHGRRLLISGVHEKAGKEEIARASGVEPEALECCVDLDKRARNTIGNAIQTRRWAETHGFRSLVVVTSSYHLPRTLEEFRHTLRGVAIHGVPVVSETASQGRWWSDAGLFRLTVLEYAKILVTRARHLIEDDPEFSRLPVMVGRQKPVLPVATPAESQGQKPPAS
jgi:uncharacterized SAM-binding protein YcdF (DUF218 family)